MTEAVVRGMSRTVAFGVFLLLVAGALVTSTESGLAVPDLPLSYGRLMPPMVGGIFYEHGHRLIAAGMSTLVGLQVAVLFWGEKRKLVRRLGLAAFGAILLQALLGGLTVLFLLPPAVSSAHAGLAQIVFALTAAIALMTSRTWKEASFAAPRDGELLARAKRLVTLATGAVYVQIVLGAVMRHTAAGLAVPDFPLSFGRLFPTGEELARRGVAIHLAHRLFALVVAALAVAAIAALRKVPGLFARIGLLWGALIAVQLLLGALSIWTKKAVPVTTAHLAVGGLCWVTGVLALLLLRRAGGGLPAREESLAPGEAVAA
jgi:cytochrome c oxidase assembly protein subunit 15